MSRLSFVLPAAAMLLAGVVMAPSAQAAPAAGVPEALKTAAAQGSDVAQVAWWDRHRRHGRHDGRDRDRGHHRWGRHHDNDRGHNRWGRHRDHDRGHHRWGRGYNRYDG